LEGEGEIMKKGIISGMVFMSLLLVGCNGEEKGGQGVESEQEYPSLFLFYPSLFAIPSFRLSTRAFFMRIHHFSLSIRHFFRFIRHFPPSIRHS